jgi:hypothetical protein
MKPIKLSNKDRQELEENKKLDSILAEAVRKLPMFPNGIIDLQWASMRHPRNEPTDFHCGDKWKKRYNSQHGEFKGKRQIAAYDIPALGSMKNIWEGLGIVVDTYYEYFDRENGRILHHPNNKIKGVKPWASKVFKIPVYKETPLSDVQLTDTGRYLLAALFGGSNMDRLTERLHAFVSGREGVQKEVKFYTLPTGYRRGTEDKPVYKAVVLGMDIHGLSISGGGENIVDDGWNHIGFGKTCGVQLNPKQDHEAE